MPENLKDIVNNEIADIVGTISGMCEFQEGQEQFLMSELLKLANNLVKLSYNEAINDIKRSADRLIQEKMWEV